MEQSKLTLANGKLALEKGDIASIRLIPLLKCPDSKAQSWRELQDECMQEGIKRKDPIALYTSYLAGNMSTEMNQLDVLMLASDFGIVDAREKLAWHLLRNRKADELKTLLKTKYHPLSSFQLIVIEALLDADLDYLPLRTPAIGSMLKELGRAYPLNAPVALCNGISACFAFWATPDPQLARTYFNSIPKNSRWAQPAAVFTRFLSEELSETGTDSDTQNAASYELTKLIKETDTTQESSIWRVWDCAYEVILRQHNGDQTHTEFKLAANTLINLAMSGHPAACEAVHAFVQDYDSLNSTTSQLQLIKAGLEANNPDALFAAFLLPHEDFEQLNVSRTQYSLLVDAWFLDSSIPFNFLIDSAMDSGGEERAVLWKAVQTSTGGAQAPFSEKSFNVIKHIQQN